MNTQKKREHEKKIVSTMIRIYCHHNHHSKDSLCASCAELETYAHMRTDVCPFMETKTFCANCTVHCYKPERRLEIKKVMRFAGPRMLWNHPILTIKHAYLSVLEKIRGRKN